MGLSNLALDGWYSTPLNDCQAIIDSESATDNYKVSSKNHKGILYI